MKTLKLILGGVYPILILLLLANAKCQRTDTPNNVEDDRRTEETRTDSASIIRQAQETGNSGNLKITLLWSFQGDIDLHVKQPNDNVIYWKTPKDTSTGGFLDVDNQDGGVNSAENIFWEKPITGEYMVSLVYYAQSNKTKIAESGTCTVVVFQDGKSPQRYEIQMNNVKDKKSVTKILIP